MTTKLTLTIELNEALLTQHLPPARAYDVRKRVLEHTARHIRGGLPKTLSILLHRNGNISVHPYRSPLVEVGSVKIEEAA